MTQPILSILSTLHSQTNGPQTHLPDGDFAAEGRCPSSALSIELADVGALRLPLTPEQAAEVQRTSQPARHGLREQTLMDARVRDGGEVAAGALRLRWQRGALEALQRDVAAALGASALEARLHKLLIYGKGQFFKPHQDTEKHDRMVATLVMVLPAAHIGGSLVVRHKEQQRQFESQQLDETDIVWFAFYADCRHEVLPVKAGWRVALSFDLVLPDTPARAPARADARLTTALRQQFGLPDTPKLSPWILLLDHEYTERGLRWHLLKGPDRQRVDALRAAADALGLQAQLALAEVRETWTAYEIEGRRHGGDAGYEPGDLLEQSMTLDFWVDSQGRVASRSALPVALADAVSFTETGEDHLVNEEYEGYMGNYGETVDYWYRRAALVLWTPQAAAKLRFTIDFEGALAVLTAQARAGVSAAAPLDAQVSAAIAELQRGSAEQGHRRWADYSCIAAALEDDGVAADLVQCVKPCEFQASDAAPVARLAAARGAAWMTGQFRRWAGLEVRTSGPWRGPGVPGRSPSKPPPWPTPLADFITACLTAGLDAELAEAWMGVHLEVHRKQDSHARQATPAHRAADLPARIAAASELARAAQQLPEADAHLKTLLDHVDHQPELYPPTALAPLVIALGSAATVRRGPGRKLCRRVTDALRQVVERPERAQDDHALQNVEWTCHCPDCRAVATWAASADGRPLTLAMAEARRSHVTRALQDAGAPIATTTLRQGSPHKLQLTKPADLRARDLVARTGAARDLHMLESREP